jgi:hypothetical protein
MDEGKKAASVAQLKELHDAVVPRLDALEAEDKAENESAATVAVLASQVLMLQQKLASADARCSSIEALCEQMMAKLDEPDTPVDLAPVITLITQMGAQQMALITKCLQDMAAMSAKPLTRTGEAVLPGGGRITLQVTETRM